MIANTLPPVDLSGVGEQVLQLSEGLRERGHEVEILGRGPGGATGPKLFFPLAIVRPALAAIARLRPHVVQVHESDGGLLAAVLRRRRPRPRIVSLLQVSYVEERASVRPLEWRGEVLGRPGAVERRFRRWKAPLHIFLGRLSARSSDLVLAPSLATARELSRDYGVTVCEVVPNASGGRAVEPRPVAAIETGEQGLLFVGRLRIRKGVEVLLRALALVGRPVPLWIAGEGEHREALEACARRFDLATQVRFLGRCDAGQIRWLLDRATALVVPSIYEGMPLVVLEAMSAGAPVIASRVSGIPEVVEDGVSGWLVPPEDPEALASVLIAATADPDERRRRGEAGRERLRTRYAPAAVAALWEAAAEKLRTHEEPE